MDLDFPSHERVRIRVSTVGGGTNGSIVWFETDEFEAVLRRVDTTSAEVADGRLANPLAQHREIWLRDLDGYVVVVASYTEPSEVHRMAARVRAPIGA